MRMSHYFAVAAGLLVPALLATALSGVLAWPAHLLIGLFSSILAIGTHTLLILFMIVTGRVLREAIRARDLPRGFLDELNEFFARRSAYPLAILAALSVVAAAVLGYASHGFGVSPTVHLLVGLGAIGLNLYAIGPEARALLDNQRLLDRAARELDRLDEECAARGPASPASEPTADPATRLWRAGWTLAVGSWLPYLYWALIVWRGDFARVSIHPWIEGSGLGLALLVLARARRSESRPQPEG